MTNLQRMKLFIFWGCIILISSCSFIPAEDKNIFNSTEIDKTTAYHSTTRQFQRKVFFSGDKWVIFYTNGQNSFYRTSIDGVTWSKARMIEEGVKYSSSIDIIFKDSFFYYFSSLDEDPLPNRWKIVLYARKGFFNGEVIQWMDLHKVFGDITGDESIFYSSASIDSDGFFWVASRRALPSGGPQNVIVTRSVKPLDVSGWTPRAVGLTNTDKKSMAPQIIGIGDSKTYLVAKATEKGKVFGNSYDGTKLGESDSLIGKSSSVAGDDKRMSMVFESTSISSPGRIHLVFVDNNDHLRYRLLTAPYAEQNWNPPLERPGRLIGLNPSGRPAKSFTCVLAIDRSRQPAQLYLVYGETKFQGKDPREITGELRLLRYAEGRWSDRSLLLTQPGSTDNWYPSMIENADRKIGVLYLKGRTRPLRIMFSSVDTENIRPLF